LGAALASELPRSNAGSTAHSTDAVGSAGSAVLGDEVEAGEVLAHLGVLAGLEQCVLEVSDPASGQLQRFLLLFDQPALPLDLPLFRPALVASEHENLTP
jgi:hypothetical protein